MAVGKAKSRQKGIVIRTTQERCADPGSGPSPDAPSGFHPAVIAVSSPFAFEYLRRVAGDWDNFTRRSQKWLPLQSQVADS